MPYRNGKFDKRGAGHPTSYTDGRMADSRVAFVDLLFGKVNVRQHWGRNRIDENATEEEINRPDPSGPSLWLEFALRWLRRPIALNLTNLTQDELSALRTVIDLAFDLAEPVVKDRDKVAQDAKEAGDDSYSRVYRQVPVLVIREGKILPYGEGVRDGSADVSGGPGGEPSGSTVGPGDGRGGGILGAGDGLVDEESSGTSASDDGPEAD